MSRLKYDYIYVFGVIIAVLCPSISIAQGLNYTDANGLKQGVWKAKLTTGGGKYKGQFKDDIPFGTFKYYDKRGAIISSLKYISNDSAVISYFHSNDRVSAKGSYVDQFRHGVWEFYDQGGILKSRKNYIYGTENGIYIVYNKNGTRSRETSYVDGIENGYRKTYNIQGEILTEGDIVDGHMNGRQIIYSAGKISVQGAYKHAVKDGEWTYYDKKGDIYKKEVYLLGERIN